jgi:hypothetical protein
VRIAAVGIDGYALLCVSGKQANKSGEKKIELFHVICFEEFL